MFTEHLLDAKMFTPDPPSIFIILRGDGMVLEKLKWRRSCSGFRRRRAGL